MIRSIDWVFNVHLLYLYNGIEWLNVGRSKVFVDLEVKLQYIGRHLKIDAGQTAVRIGSALVHNGPRIVVQLLEQCYGHVSGGSSHSRVQNMRRNENLEGKVR